MNAIRERRKQAGLTQDQLAELANIHVSFLSRIETGKRHLRAYESARLAKALGCTIPELLDDSQTEDVIHAASN